MLRSRPLRATALPTIVRTLVAVAAVGACASIGQAESDVLVWGQNVVAGQKQLADLIAVAAGGNHSLGLDADGSIVAWGYNGMGECEVPDPNTGFVAVAAGFSHSLGLDSNGSVIAWGSNQAGQCEVPAPNSGIVAIAASGSHSLALTSLGEIVAWGSDTYGESTEPSPNSGFTAIAAGMSHSLALRTDGSIVAWGRNNYGQCNVPTPNSGFVAIGAGHFSSYGIRADGSIIAWGINDLGQRDVPEPNLDFVAVAGGDDHAIGLRSDGTVVAWGSDFQGQLALPDPNAGFAAVAAGSYHSVALRTDGRMAAWGSNSACQCNAPATVGGMTSIASGYHHHVGLLADGTITAWGDNSHGQCDIPYPNQGFLAVTAGLYFSAALREDGSIAAWGRNDYGQIDVPEPNTGFSAVSAGGYHVLGLKADGSIAAWGRTTEGQCAVPLPNSGFVAAAAGGSHSLGLKSQGNVVAWGNNLRGQCNVPAPNEGFIDIAGGGEHSLGRKSDGSLVAWGRNDQGQCTIPMPNADFVDMCGGGYHSLGLKASGELSAWGSNAQRQCNVPISSSGWLTVSASTYGSSGIWNTTSAPQWPDCTPAPCLRLRVSSTSPVTATHARLSGDSPKSGKVEDPVAIADGFVVFDRNAIDSAVSHFDAIDRIDLLDSDDPPNLVGHIGFRYTDDDFDSERSVDAFLFLHDDRPRMQSTNPSWSYFQDGWGYYVEGEYPVSMLVPPHDSIAGVQGGTRVPVVFLHGVSGYHPRFGGVPEALDPTLYDGWSFAYPYDQPIGDSSLLLGEALRSLLREGLVGCPAYTVGRADIVAHSMGGLVARRYIQSAGYAQDVNKLAMLGTPNHGSHMSYRMFYRDFAPGETLGEAFATHDPEAPAHEQMTPASAFLFELNATPPRGLGSGDAARDYLVIAGAKNTWVDLFHQEIWHQDDDVVAVSSAGMLERGIPLVVVQEDHESLPTAQQLAANLEVFLDDAGYDPADPGFTSWVGCRINTLPSNACSDVDGLDTAGGILELQIHGGAPDARHYQIEGGDQGFLDFKPNAFIDWKDSITRVGDSGNRYFSTNTKSINEIKWVDIADGSYRGRLMEKRWVLLWPRWVPIGVSEPFTYASLRTTMTTLNFGSVAGAIAGASNGAALAPLAGLSKSLVQYTYTTDASVDTLVFSLSSPAGMGDHALHGFSLESPGGIGIDPAYAANAADVEFEDGGAAGYAQYLIADPAPGTWLVRHDDSVLEPLVYVFLNARLSAELSLARDGYVTGDTLTCLASFSGAEQCAESQLSLSAYFVAPDSSIAESLGSVALEEFEPGQYRGIVPDASEGEYTFTLQARCTGTGGEIIDRETSRGALVSRPTDQFTGVVPAEGAQPPGRHPFGISTVAPNPFNPRTVVSWWLARPGRVHLAVYGLSGRRLASLYDGFAEAGEHSLLWSGQDDRGRRLPSGVYFVRLATGGGAEVRKIAILK